MKYSKSKKLGIVIILLVAAGFAIRACRIHQDLSSDTGKTAYCVGYKFGARFADDREGFETSLKKELKFANATVMKSSPHKYLEQSSDVRALEFGARDGFEGRSARLSKADFQRFSGKGR